MTHLLGSNATSKLLCCSKVNKTGMYLNLLNLTFTRLWDDNAGRGQSLCAGVFLWLNTTSKLFWSHWAKLKWDRHVLESPKLDIYEPGPLVLVWRCYLGYHLPRSRTIQESQNNAFSPVNLASKSAHFIWIGNTFRLALWCSPAGCRKSCGVSSRYLQKLGSELSQGHSTIVI